MHIRRALLLFAIVLGLAAIAASVSRTPGDSDESTSQPAVPSETEQAPSPSASPGDAAPVSGVRLLEFEADLDQTRRLNAGQSATVLVEVEEPGLVEIPDLGLSAPAEPLTPARFEILPSSPGRVDIEFTSVEDDLPEPAGTLVVRETAEG